MEELQLLIRQVKSGLLYFRLEISRWTILQSWNDQFWLITIKELRMNNQRYTTWEKATVPKIFKSRAKNWSYQTDYVIGLGVWLPSQQTKSYWTVFSICHLVIKVSWEFFVFFMLNGTRGCFAIMCRQAN